MTLVELLMVVTIMTILMAVAIPMVRPAFQNRQLREATRQINAFFAGAMARAAETGRPVGVWIEASGVPGDPQYATRLYLAEVAPSFTGAALGSRATIEFPSPSAPSRRVRIHPGRMNLTTNRWENSGSGIPAEPLLDPTNNVYLQGLVAGVPGARTRSSSFASITRDRCIPV